MIFSMHIFIFFCSVTIAPDTSKEGRKMLTSVFGTIVNETNMIRISWNLCNQVLKNVKNVIFNTKFLFISLFSISEELVRITKENSQVDT